MTNISKLNKLLLYLFGLILIGLFLFYWYEIRPAKIRHDCSWTKVTEAAIPTISKEEAEASREEYNKCIEENDRKRKEAADEWSAFNLSDFPCEQKLKYERAYTPEREWYRKSEKDEYEFCLHEKGL